MSNICIRAIVCLSEAKPISSRRVRLMRRMLISSRRSFSSAASLGEVLVSVAVLVAIIYYIGSKYSTMDVRTGLEVGGDGNIWRQGCSFIRIEVGKMSD